MEELKKETEYVVGKEYIYKNKVVKSIMSPKVLLGIVGDQCSDCCFKKYEQMFAR